MESCKFFSPIFRLIKKLFRKNGDMFQRSEYDDNLKTPDIHFFESLPELISISEEGKEREGQPAR